MNKLSKILINFCRLATGLLFIFSGFSKAIDPTGFAIKLVEYFDIVGLHNTDTLSLVLSFFMNSLEFLIGVALLFNVYMRLTAWATLLLMSYFTILTFLLAIFNPITDCGCFGDVIKLTNWETFLKNIILDVPITVIFLARKKFVTRVAMLFQGYILGAVAIFIFSISLYSYRHLPLIDFMPFNVGSYLPGKMVIPENAPTDKYKTILYYSKKGKTKEFTEENYPWKDTTWKFVDSKSILLKKGYTPPIHDFAIYLPDGTNATDKILNDTMYNFIVISSNLKKASVEGLKKADKLSSLTSNQPNCRFYFLTASPSEVVSMLRDKYQTPLQYGQADETSLKTIIRSNPGIILLRKGVVLGKWHYNDFDNIYIPDGNYLAKQLSAQRTNAGYLMSISLFLGLLLLGVIIGWVIPNMNKVGK